MARGSGWRCGGMGKANSEGPAPGAPGQPSRAAWPSPATQPLHPRGLRAAPQGDTPQFGRVTGPGPEKGTAPSKDERTHGGGVRLPRELGGCLQLSTARLWDPLPTCPRRLRPHRQRGLARTERGKENGFSRSRTPTRLRLSWNHCRSGSTLSHSSRTMWGN